MAPVAERTPKQKLIKGDTVMIRRGKEKGKRGTVKAIFPKSGQAMVEGINIVKRHTKPGQAGAQSGGIFEKESPLPVSALMYVCIKCNTPTRLKRGVNAEGTRQRICIKCGEPAPESAKVQS
jgi:large subunit ribosomal protein L24